MLSTIEARSAPCLDPQYRPRPVTCPRGRRGALHLQKCKVADVPASLHFCSLWADCSHWLAMD